MPFHFFFSEATVGMGVHSYFGFWWGFFFRKIVTVISIFFTQLLGCFSLNLVLLRGAKLTPSKSKYLCLQMWCDNTLCAKFPTGGRVQECPQGVRRYFSHCSSLNPCRLHIDTPVCKLAKNQLSSPQAAAAVTSQKICLRKSVVFGNNHTPSFWQPWVWTGVFWLCLSPKKLDVETESSCSRFQFHYSFSFEQLTLWLD